MRKKLKKSQLKKRKSNSLMFALVVVMLVALTAILLLSRFPSVSGTSYTEPSPSPQPTNNNSMASQIPNITTGNSTATDITSIISTTMWLFPALGMFFYLLTVFLRDRN
jgi:beta-lactamase regulating signal transducer with metallopeptidase domain